MTSGRHAGAVNSVSGFGKRAIRTSTVNAVISDAEHPSSASLASIPSNLAVSKKTHCVGSTGMNFILVVSGFVVAALTDPGTYAPLPVNGSPPVAADGPLLREPFPPGTYAPAPVNGSALTQAPDPENAFCSPTFCTMKLTTCSR